MARVGEIPRTAAFAWSQSTTNLLLATGTRAGAVDADFSSDTKLELWDLDLGNRKGEKDLKPIGSAATDSRFYDIAWSRPDSDRGEGIIAGALENGSLDLWDAAKLRSGSTDAHISRTNKHTGPIKTLQFNPHRPELLATSGSKGELYITDLNNASTPFRLGGGAARADDFDALDWNKQVAHIMATAGNGGFVTVWDVKSKKESLTLNNYGRKAVSSVAWNPDLPTKLATAVASDQDPLILMWDLRNSSAPERILKGHEQGVLSLSWCRQDSSLLLSCGRDNRNICWNPHTGEQIGEFPIVTNWTFQTQWNPRQPSFLATASFDGKIAVNSIQSTNGPQEQGTAATAQADDGADFFAKAHSSPSGSSFSLSKAPKWLQRPVGATFGFGGKLVLFNPNSDGKGSKVKISAFASDPTVEKSISEFSEALKENDLAKVCEAKVAATETEEQKTDWKIISTLLSQSPRKGLLTYLGFSDETPAVTSSDDVSKEEDVSKLTAETNGAADPKANRLSSFFDTAGENQSFLGDLAASKGARTNNPFNIYTGSETDAEKEITRALMLGSFEQALDICLKEKRMSDAFMIAICGGQKCIDKAQAAYFAQQSQGPNYLRLLASVVGKNLWDVVYNADLSNWSEVMATLCTFADETEFPDLCEALGDRLDETADSRVHACFCYLAGSKLEKIVPIWLDEMQAVEKNHSASADDESAFSVHVQALQYFIEKISIFRKATGYEDKESQEKNESWKLEPLYAKYAEYADVVAAYGHLDLADQYLNLLPANYPAAEVARDRISKATKKAPATMRAAQNNITTTSAARTAIPAAAPLGAPNFLPQPSFQPTPAPRGYAPSNVQQTYQATASPYAPANNFTSSYQPPAQGVPTTQSPLSAPPQDGGPPKAKATVNGTNWNDLPESFAGKPPISRRGTPGIANATVTSPFVNQPSSSPPIQNFGPPIAQRAATPIAPPPKASGPPRISSPLTDRSLQSMDPVRPSSSAANSYAPQVQAQSIAPPTSLPPRGASPYNAPPTGPPPSNRYAPAPSAQSTPAPGMSRPPAMAPRAPAANPYAPQQAAQPPLQYGAQSLPNQTQLPSQGPPLGPPPSSRGPPQGPPMSGTPQISRPPSSSQSQRIATPTTSKYPPGDRAHIPAEFKPIYEILGAEMQRVKGLAPANFKAQVDAADKRLSLLFDALNNDEISAEHAMLLKTFSQAMQSRDFEQAQGIHNSLTTQMGPTVPWMLGLKNLIIMSRATPV